MNSLTAIAALVAAIGTLTGVAGLIVSKKKTKAEADSVVVSSSEAALRMWQLTSLDQQRQITAMRTEMDADRAKCRKIEIRCARLERALRAAGISLPEDN